MSVKSQERAVKTYCLYDAARDNAGLTDYGVAKHCGIHPSTLSDWKAGRYTPKLETLAKIAAAVGMSLDDFVRMET